MNIDELIKQLETADGLATGGEWTADKRYNIWNDGKIVDRPVEATVFDAKAIAIRHNTAKMVVESLVDYKRLVELQDTSGRWGRIAAKYSIERDQWRERAEAAQDRISTARSIITDLQLHMDPNAICDPANEVFDRAMEWLTESPTPTAPAKSGEETTDDT